LVLVVFSSIISSIIVIARVSAMFVMFRQRAMLFHSLGGVDLVVFRSFPIIITVQHDIVSFVFLLSYYNVVL